MSRGLGVWQRGILAAVDHFGMVYLRDLLSDDARKSDRNAVERAAWRLVAAGRIEIKAYWCGSPRLLATRPGWPVGERPKRAARRPLSVGEIHARNAAHTYWCQNVVPVWPADRHTHHGKKARTA